MSDPVTQALMAEGQARRSSDWRIPPGVQAQRDAEALQIQQREVMPNGGGAIPTSNVIQKQADPITAALLAEANPMQQSAQPPAAAPQAPRQRTEIDIIGRRMLGSAEGALSVATGVLAAPVGMLAGAAKTLVGGKFGTQEGVRMGEARAREVMNSLTYQPRLEEGQQSVGAFGKAMDASKLQGLGPTEGVAIAGMLSGVGKPAAQAARPAQSGQLGSVGAAGAGTIEQARALAANAPGTLASVERLAGKRGSAINLEVVKRHAEAETLPVPVRLTEGQATQDVRLLSNEKNLRAKHEPFAQRFNQQNADLIENLQRIRENAAPDVYVRSKPDVGGIVIDAYRAKDAALESAIGAKYQALRDANGGAFPLDSKAFVKSADAALHKALLYDHVPAEIRATLGRVSKNGMTFENFEALRTNLARIQRSPSADGNVKAAAGVIRDALETMPMPKGAEHLKPLADSARAAARERFQLIESDPAYKGVVRGTASADKLIDYVLNKYRKHVEAMVANLPPEARQALAAGVIDQLTESARIVNGAGNFSQAGYNKALQRVSSKLDLFVDAPSRKHLENLGAVARYTQGQPVGSFVNNSNTLTAALGEGVKEAGKNTLEGVANYVGHGAPVGTLGRKFFERRAINKQVEKALKPGAGILLKDVGR